MVDPADLRALIETRELYDKVHPCDVAIDNSGLSPREVASAIRDRLAL